MSLSLSYSWSLNRDQMLLMAFQEINVYGDFDTVATMQADTGKYNRAINVLNGLLKMWSIDGVNPPKRKVGYIFTQKGQKTYNLGTVTNTDNCTNSFEHTALSVANILNDTVLNVSSTANMNISDNIGVELDNGTRQWTTISNVNSATQVTITTGLTGTAAVGNTVVAYTTKINKPLKILYALRYNLNTANEVQLDVRGHDEYYKMPSKDLMGAPNIVYYDKQISGAVPHYSTLYSYPVPETVIDVIIIVYTRCYSRYE